MPTKYCVYVVHRPTILGPAAQRATWHGTSPSFLFFLGQLHYSWSPSDVSVMSLATDEAGLENFQLLARLHPLVTLPRHKTPNTKKEMADSSFFNTRITFFVSTLVILRDGYCHRRDVAKVVSGQLPPYERQQTRTEMSRPHPAEAKTTTAWTSVGAASESPT